MIGWKILVTKKDGTKDSFAVSPRVIVSFERAFKVGLAAAFTNDQKMEHIYWLAWESERAAGRVVPLFDDYLDLVQDVEMDTTSVPSDGTR